ncbi:hypothetical protein AAE478_006912 [Parahypoxylon ruwenzoriense]
MAPPPPATPTPHRFLVPRRSQQSGQDTPRAFQGGGGAARFQATPRFSLHSTPRGTGSGSGAGAGAPSSSAATPASVGAGSGAFFQRNPRSTADPINDSIDSSPCSAVEQLPGGSRHGGRHDPIEAFDFDAGADADAVPESSPVVRGHGDYGESSEAEEEDAGMRSRSPKRRRISIDSNYDTEDGKEPLSLYPEYEESCSGEDTVMHNDNKEDTDVDFIQSFSPDDEDDEQPPSDEDMEDDAVSPLLPRRTLVPAHQHQQQPTFHKAPRFKPTEAPEGPYNRDDPLPDAFSPHRRKGAKYIPGGLAAEVRNWFVDVWAAGAGSGAYAARRDGGEEWTAKVHVEECRAAPGTAALIVGRYVDKQDGEDDEPHEGKEGIDKPRSARFLLAGSPRLTGLDKTPEIRPGAVVGIGRPTWEVALPDLGRWAVVCEWAILG